MARKTSQKPPWAMSEAEQEAVTAEAQAGEQTEAEAEAIVEEVKAKSTPTRYSFGKLQAMKCPYDERVSVLFHVGTRWGVFGAPVKDDDGKGWMRRVRNIAPYWAGLENIVNPLTEEALTNPDPDNLDSYEVITKDLFNLWGEKFFFKWLTGEGWDEALAEASGTTPNS